MLTLALSDQWVIGLAGVQMLVNIGLTVALFYIGSKSRKIETLEAEVKASASQLIDQKVKTMGEGLRASIDHLTEQLAAINQRLNSGEASFNKLGERDHKIELTLAAKLDELKDYIRTNCATRSSVASLFTKVEQLQQSVAATQGRPVHQG